MSNPSGPDRDDERAGEGDQETPESDDAATSEDTPVAPQDHEPGPTGSADAATEQISVEPPTEQISVEQAADSEPATEVFASAKPESPPPPSQPTERRFTAPSGFDAGATQKIDTPPEPATEIIRQAPDGADPASSDIEDATESAPKVAAPQVIPPREDAPKPPPQHRRSWGWVVAVVLAIAALVAIAILGTILLTRNSAPAVSQEEQVSTMIKNFDVAVQKGDLATLRSITCGTTRDGYVRYDERAFADTHAKVAAAKQYPVVASIDQVIVNGDHAEANVTTFMAYAPQTRSVRSFDLQFRDDQWKICQAPE